MKYKCEECKGKTKNLHGPMKNLCRKCFFKSDYIHLIPGPLIFEEDVDVVVQPSSFGITETHAKLLEKRLEELFPKRGKIHRFTKITKYLRLLVLSDIATQSHSREKNK